MTNLCGSVELWFVDCLAGTEIPDNHYIEKPSKLRSVLLYFISLFYLNSVSAVVIEDNPGLSHSSSVTSILLATTNSSTRN